MYPSIVSGMYALLDRSLYIIKLIFKKVFNSDLGHI